MHNGAIRKNADHTRTVNFPDSTTTQRTFEQCTDAELATIQPIIHHLRECLYGGNADVANQVEQILGFKLTFSPQAVQLFAGGWKTLRESSATRLRRLHPTRLHPARSFRCRAVHNGCLARRWRTLQWPEETAASCVPDSACVEACMHEFHTQFFLATMQRNACGHARVQYNGRNGANQASP